MKLTKAIEIENKINHLLKDYDLALSMGNENAALEAEIEIEKLLNEFNPNEIRLVTEKTINQELQ
jgi:hypothetical protein